MELWSANLMGLLAAVSEPGMAELLLERTWIVLKVAIGLGLVIFVHELGHFLAAKAFGVKVEKFYVGFDVPISIGPIRFPRRLGWFRWGETEYGIGIIPLGGYVKMLGQDDDPRKAEEEAKRIRMAGGETGESATPPPLDPRSYPAKPVVQRMVIISAGVVMNLIFAVIFAAAAFGWGVPYTTTVIGHVIPGDPAWQAGIEEGAEVVAVGDQEPQEDLHFRDMRIAIFSHGLENGTAPLPVTVRNRGELTTYHLEPTARHDPKGRIVSIGVAPAAAPQLSSVMTALPGTPAAEALDDPLLLGAEIVAYDGHRRDPEDATALSISKHLAEHLDKPVELELALRDQTTRSVTVPPAPYRSLGFDWAVGAIAAIAQGSPAAEADLRPGDRIVALNGQPVQGAHQLWIDGNRLGDSPVELTVQRPRADQSPEEFSVELSPSAARAWLPTDPGEASELGLDRLGIAFAVLPEVAQVIPESPAAEAGLETGDQILKLAATLPEDADAETYSQLLLEELLNPGVTLNGYHNAALMMGQIQRLPEGSNVAVYFKRDRIHEAVLKVTSQSDRYWPIRGIMYAPLKRTHVARSLGAAISLGFEETGRRMMEVLNFLKLLVTGKVARDMVGGPLGIAYVAGSEAAEGITRLLLFLTLLSANLAILNFLPIPALDGGHMVFLIAEAVLGRPVDEQLQMRLTMIGVVGLLCLMLFVFVNDLFTIGGLGG